MATLKWVNERWTATLLPALTEATTEEEIKMICQNEMAYWLEKYPDKPNSLRTPHTQSRNLVRASGLPEGKKETILKHLSLGEERWQEINQGTGVKLAERLENQLFLANPDKIVDQAGALLAGERWQDIAAGLVMATGRRATEILKTAQFERATDYSVIFSGQIKHSVNAFEIPTLTGAGPVISALERLRDILDTQDMTEHEVSNAFHRALGASVKRCFGEIIPSREGEEISPHTLRSVYLRLAIFFYAPLGVDAETYAAEISGHRKRSKAAVEKEERSYGAAPHYSEYKIVDRAGQIDGRQGVKLGPDVPVLGVFAGSHNGATPVSARSMPILAAPAGPLTPESLLVGEDLKTVVEGMAAAGIVDFVAYIKMALKRQAKTDLGLAKRDTVADVSQMSMDELARVRKPATAAERIRRAVAALAAYNDAEGRAQAERWYVNNTLLKQLIGGRFEAITAWLEERQGEIKALNDKYELTPAYNRKPVDVKDVVKVE
jgi:hypothetical protein